MNGSICQVVEQCDHSGGLFVVGDGLIGKGTVAGGHLVDVVGFGEGRSPVCLPVVPRLIDGWATAPFAPCKFNATTVDRGFGAGQYHDGLGDGYACVECEGLAIFLVCECGRLVGELG